jgi:HAD superfamily hydrolase (TIGR01509 family)
MSINAVIFDMDGVLVDTEDLWQENEVALFAELGFRLDEEMLKETRGLVTSEMVSHWVSHFRIDSVDPEALIKRYDDYMLKRMRNGVPLMEGAREAIRFFAGKGLPVALASCSTHEHIDAVVDKHGLRDQFRLIVSAAGVMPGKPHPEVYLHTARELGVEPSSCLAIEDTFFGVISARAARMKVLALPNPLEYDQPRFQAADMKIRSLTEINEMLYQKLTSN